MNDKCVFEINEHNCTALMTKDCFECVFFKTPKELARGREAADARIASLPERQRDYIRQKYR